MTTALFIILFSMDMIFFSAMLFLLGEVFMPCYLSCTDLVLASTGIALVLTLIDIYITYALNNTNGEGK